MNSKPKQLLILAPTGEEARTIANSLKLPRKAQHHWLGAIAGKELHLIQTGMGRQCAQAAKACVSEENIKPETVLLTGYAAGLSKELTVGDVILADSVQDDGRVMSLQANGQLMSLNFPCATLTSVDKVIESPTEKKSLYESTGAACADMESGPLLAWCQQQAIPLIILRVISDAAEDVMPTWLAECVNERGDVRLAQVIKTIALCPDRWTVMFQIIQRVTKARKSLAQAMDKIEPIIGKHFS